MYIKDIVIDGFKSYGKRTEIFGFDSQFTAITGLNGTGKSNILDAICFVMGITNLGQVRATALQDLVYKNGQAGIKRASVTLVFDNSDMDQCPMGYDKCKEISITRQVIVGGKNKYLINGKLVQNKIIVDLFCSVKLNVNNPNFLIMQGRITKVINMKPIEILSLIEEAAGTSTYEIKKIDASRNINKKDLKLKEIDTQLSEEIEPKLQRLRNEREQYIEFKNIVRDIEYFTKISISHKYLKATKSVEQFGNSIETMITTIEVNKKQIVNNKNDCDRIDDECNKLQLLIDVEVGGELKRLHELLAENSKNQIVSVSSKNVIFNGLQMEKNNAKSLEKTIDDDRKLLAIKQQEMNATENIFKRLKDTNDNDEQSYENARRKFEAISTGLVINDDGDSESLQQQLITANHQISENNTNLKRYEMEFKHIAQLLNEKRNALQSGDSAYLADKAQITNTENEINKLQAQLSNLNYQEGTLEQLQTRKAAVLNEMRDIKFNLERRNAHQFEFHYSDPEPNFDRKSVKGMICKLFDVINPQHSLALSIVAGGHLYSVVTDTNLTSKKLLQNGQLQRRTTIIPLNKIVSSTINQDVIATAQQLFGKTIVFSAMSAVKYQKQYEKVLEFVFGKILICTDLNVAKQVAFHPNIRCKCVTLDGDIVDPVGTLTGGAPPHSASVLLEIAVIKRFELLFSEKEIELNSINQQIYQIQNIARNYQQLKEQIETYKIDLNGIYIRFAQTSYQQQQQEINELETKLNTLIDGINVAKEIQINLQDKIKEYELKINNKKEGSRDQAFNNALNEMKCCKEKSEKSKQKWLEKEQDYETLKLEIQQWEETIENGNNQLIEFEKKILEIEIQLESLTNENTELIKIADELNLKCQHQKDKVKLQNQELELKHKQREELEHHINDLELTIKRMENQILKLRNENADAFNKIEYFERKYPWIEEEKQYFGCQHTRYDYAKEDPIAAEQKLIIAAKKKTTMERTINVRAMILLECEEEKYNCVKERREIVTNDKHKIEMIIRELDKKRKSEICSAWKAIDGNLSKILSTLLPGSDAKLIPTFGQEFLQGLQLKVGFNGLWKESLNELSGGQRSLVALALILAMLKYKPSPIYILDEVDAALDLSHTQNIGNMLKTHFNNSQFIIVSLKDGMFNNANVLFKTHFENGVSGVSQIINPCLRK